ncbi:MAG: hypothetical protein RLN70_04605, partial [Rhodospirillaceae bacterium]
TSGKTPPLKTIPHEYRHNTTTVRQSTRDNGKTKENRVGKADAVSGWGRLPLEPVNQSGSSASHAI